MAPRVLTTPHPTLNSLFCPGLAGYPFVSSGIDASGLASSQLGSSSIVPVLPGTPSRSTDTASTTGVYETPPLL